MHSIGRTLTFQYSNTAIRIVSIGGKPWLIAADVFKALGIVNTSTAVKALGKDEVCLTGLIAQRPVQALSEKGLRKKLMRSAKPEAKALLDWALHEALPAYRAACSAVPAGEASNPGAVSRLAERVAELEQHVRTLRSTASM